jgi:hypothetical protein
MIAIARFGDGGFSFPVCDGSLVTKDVLDGDQADELTFMGYQDDSWPVFQLTGVRQ